MSVEAGVVNRAAETPTSRFGENVASALERNTQSGKRSQTALAGKPEGSLPRFLRANTRVKKRTRLHVATPPRSITLEDRYVPNCSAHRRNAGVAPCHGDTCKHQFGRHMLYTRGRRAVSLAPVKVCVSTRVALRSDANPGRFSS